MAVAVLSSPPSLSGLLGQSCLSDGFDHLASRRCARSTKICFGARQQMLPANCSFGGPCDADDMRVFVVSDLHTDYKENMEWVRRLSTEWYKKDVLIVAGDVAETYGNFVLTMSELKQRFHSIFYVPGNHDLWCRREAGKFVRFS
ncbi:hypothetical protein Cni_G07610 [Canna indica]|uniref:Calcineurin-like phosphoesterase domain-containing protein n=1 Tax=Canna indica TaxID=4628 RepID=A0AAQ3JZ15_9LILI|nr:hypothetical protein Cni_G07610 [Canna indica]